MSFVQLSIKSLLRHKVSRFVSLRKKVNIP